MPSIMAKKTYETTSISTAKASASKARDERATAKKSAAHAKKQKKPKAR